MLLAAPTLKLAEAVALSSNMVGAMTAAGVADADDNVGSGDA